MKGRDGDYPVGVGAHVTTVHSSDTFEPDAWASFCAAQGIEPDVRRDPTTHEVAKVEWPLAFVACTCRYSKPAVSRMHARSMGFVHRQADVFSREG